MIEVNGDCSGKEMRNVRNENMSHNGTRAFTLKPIGIKE